MWSNGKQLLFLMLPLAIADISFPVPVCAVRCWENTKYVSKCFGDPACLCSEMRYQRSVLQCLYSQCDTVHLGPALHHTMCMCPGQYSSIASRLSVPDREFLVKREADYIAGALPEISVSAGNYALESLSLPTQSSGSVPQNLNPLTSSETFQTLSVADNYPSAFTSTTIVSQNALGLPPVKSTFSTQSMFNVAPHSTILNGNQSQKFTGTGLSIHFNFKLPAFVMVLELWLGLWYFI